MPVSPPPDLANDAPPLDEAAASPPAWATTGVVSAPIATARALTKVYGRGETAVTALAGIDVDFRRGEFTAIMGPSGSGKSTLMHCMAGLDKSTSGEITVDGLPIHTMSERALTKLRRTRLGFVFQSFNLVPTLTAEENILLPLTIARRKVDHAWFDRVVSAVGLEDRLRHRPGELSGGQQQRVACARALISSPSVVFADEPTGNLDSGSSAVVLGFLRDSTMEFEQSIVMVTHDPSAASYADRVLFLSDGRFIDELVAPTSDAIIEALRRLSARTEAIAGPGKHGSADRPGKQADTVSAPERPGAGKKARRRPSGSGPRHRAESNSQIAAAVGDLDTANAHIGAMRDE